VEGGVEAGHRRHAGQGDLDRRQRGQRLRLVQRRQVGQRPQPLLDVAVEHHRPGELRAAVDDAVADRVDPLQPPSVRVTAGSSARPRGAGRSWEATTVSFSSSTRSFRLLEPALTTRIRIGAAPTGPRSSR
jgi:hypothetical protein